VVISDLKNQDKYMLVHQMQFNVLDLSQVNVIVDIMSLLESVPNVKMYQKLKLANLKLMH